MCSFRAMTLGELEAVQFIKNIEPSLRSLSDEIKDLYSALFRVFGDLDPDTKLVSTSATVSLVSDSIEEYLKTQAETKSAEDSKEQTSTRDASEAEVRIVKRFLESVCDPKLYNKFELETFFERRIRKRTAKVEVDLENAHLKIATTCIKAITSEGSADMNQLISYATDYFSSHLDTVDPSLTYPQAKISMGPHLVKIFTNEKAIERWWAANNMWLRYTWLYDDESPDLILKWLQDSAVTKLLSEEDKRWVRSLSSKSEPNADL